jgi:histidinol-phosphate aminotransferase
VIGLAQNESAFPPSPRAIEAARAALDAPMAYPDSDWRALRRAIGEVHGVDPDLVLCSAGSMDVIGALIQAFVGPGDRLLSTAHAYGYFQTAARFAGAAYDAVPEPDLTVSVDLLLEAVRPETRLVAVANPGNPTGTRIARGDLVRLREGLPDDVILLIDEAYAEFTDHLGEQVFDLVESGNTVVTRSFSKAYALAGQRIGWGLFPQGLGEHARKLLTPGGVTHASLAAAEAAVRDRDYLAWLIRATTAIRETFASGLARIGMPPVPSCTNFVLVPFESVAAAEHARAALQREAIIVRPMGAYDLPHCLRITVGQAEDMDLTLQVLTDWKAPPA